MDVTETTHVGGRKYRAVAEGGIKVDIYVPYQSELGQRLRLPVEALLPYAEVVSGRRAIRVGAHLATKFAALLDRPESNPGEKDRAEIWGLLPTADPADFASVVKHGRAVDLAGLVAEGFQLLGDLGLNRQERQQLRAWATQYQVILSGRRSKPIPEHVEGLRRPRGGGRRPAP
jgi:hypothetical protein